MSKRRKPQVEIGPHDHGRKMSVADFDEAIGQEGSVYELNSGVIEVIPFPTLRETRQKLAVRNQLIVYSSDRPGIVQAVSDATDSKILLEFEHSERHPELSVYKDPMPETKCIWYTWIPTIAIEIVAEDSVKRDYEEEPAEYLAFGIQEYWIVDGLSKLMKVQTRFGGRWKDRVVKPSRKYTTRHLPGFSLDLKRVFAAAK